MYILKHDTPEISLGAVLKLNHDTNRYDVINLEDVARYPLKSSSHFSFHREIVESKHYWFELVEDEDECCCPCHDEVIEY